MKIAVMGTGPVGQALAGKLAELGHEVTVGTRDPEETLARAEPDYMGNPPFKAWQKEHPGVGLATPAEAAAEAELVVNATNGAGSVAILEAAGEPNLAEKVVVDVANPLDTSQGMPPSLFVSNTDSLGEQIQPVGILDIVQVDNESVTITEKVLRAGRRPGDENPLRPLPYLRIIVSGGLLHQGQVPPADGGESDRCLLADVEVIVTQLLDQVADDVLGVLQLGPRHSLGEQMIEQDVQPLDALFVE